MARLRVWNRGGLPSRTIPIKGRNPMLASGRLSMIGSLAERNEMDWAAIEAALGADNVVIELSPVEAGLLDRYLPETFRVGANVELQCPGQPESGIRLISDGMFGHIYRPRYTCCGEGFESSLDYGRHKRNGPGHRSNEPPHRAEQQPGEAADKDEWLAGTTETR